MIIILLYNYIIWKMFIFISYDLTCSYFFKCYPKSFSL